VSEQPAATSLKDPQQIKKIMRRVSLAVAILGFGYLYMRFSLVRPDPRITADPYNRSVCVLDHYWGWGRDLQVGDLIYFRFPGESQERPVQILALPGSTLEFGEGMVTVGDYRWDTDHPKLKALGELQPGQLALINNNVDADLPDSRTHGVMSVDGVTGRILMAWPIGGQ